MEFQKGDRVYYKKENKTGIITGEKRVLSSTNTIKYAVDFDGQIMSISETALELAQEDHGDMFTKFNARQFDTFTKFRQLITHIRIGGELTDIVYSMNYGDVEFLPHQFKPVFKFITSSSHRLLIADEVGLGKTIEALYIWRELQARSDARRLLVVAPASLTEKWSNDMMTHFGINALYAEPRDIHEKIQRALTDQSASFELVTSIQGLRRRSGLKITNPLFQLHEMFKKELEVDRKLFDLVIIDEAHSLINKNSSNYHLAETLRDLSHNMVLLSATPVNNKSEDLFNLLSLMSPTDFRSKGQFDYLFDNNRNIVRLSNILEPHPANIEETISKASELLDIILIHSRHGQDSYFKELKSTLKETLESDDKRREAYEKVRSRFFYDNYITRTRKKDVMKTTIRSAQTAQFKMTEKEKEIYDDCSLWLKERMEGTRTNVNTKCSKIFPFVLMARQREMDSSLPAAIIKWKRILDEKIPDLFDDEIISDFYEKTEEDNSVEDKKSGYESIPRICLNLSDNDLVSLKENDSKYRTFLDVIKTHTSQVVNSGERNKIIVFSFFRGTLEYLYRRLWNDGFHAIMIKGGMKRKEKEDAINRFRDSREYQIFLSSEVGAEGLDMQFANMEINYDLPWNPMRLEQRIGRIDRIGQKSKKIFIINLFCRNTISDRIRFDLYEKINIFKESIGELDDIMGETVMKIEKTLLSPSLTDVQKKAQAEAEINRICNNMRSQKKLEEEAGISKAYSNRILEGIGKAEQNKKYISRADLINYMKDFCENTGHGSDFIQDEGNPEIWHFIFSDKDRASFREYAMKNNLVYGFSSRDDIDCTFPQGIRTKARCCIDVNHPLIKWMHECNNSIFTKNINNCYVLSIEKEKMNSDRFPSNIYIFYIFKEMLFGIRNQKELIISICDKKGNILERNDSEFLLGEALFKGKNTTNLFSLVKESDVPNIARALQICRNNADIIEDKLCTNFSRDNVDLYNTMYTSIEKDYDRKIQKEEANIEKCEEDLFYTEDAKEIRNIESKIKRYKTNIQKYMKEKESDLKILEDKEKTESVTNGIAVGIIFVE